MDKEAQTSFIPKKSLSEERIQSSQPVSLTVFIGTIIFFASIAAAAGAYFYHAVLVKRVDDMSNQLELAKSRFEPSLINDLQTLDRRINGSDQLLAGHTIVSPLLDSLQALTLKTIRYTKFDYDIGKSDTTLGTDVVVNMDGQSASGYTPIALQADVFSQNKYIKDPVFSSLTIDPFGKVNFHLTFSVDRSFVSYQEMINRQAGIPQAPENTIITVPAEPILSPAQPSPALPTNSTTTN
ncbi:hypothetical protein IPF86_02435 [Candidatus Nomurabacteria bacterium]|jgi:hypothetical protein|nr:MAG: hypothetical protein IPF86_02435 [Candidatus Nomurabacteria bacterium]